MQQRTDRVSDHVPVTSRVTHDVVISAVPYDGMFVADLSARLALVLGATPYCRGTQSDGDVAAATLEESTRLVVIVHQRLWSHDSATSADASELRELASRARLPVCVIQVDDEPIPAWLSRSDRLAVHATNVEDIMTQVRELFPGTMRTAIPTVTQMLGDGDVTPPPRWGNSPPPYLDQARSATALRRALDDLEAELDRRVQMERGHATAQSAKLHRAPGRLVVQLTDVGISFSWVPARSGAVADGRLLVIEWEGVVAHGRGMGAMRTAMPGRERVFQLEATGPSDMRWRSADSGTGAYSSLDLAAQAFAGALLTRRGMTPPAQVEEA